MADLDKEILLGVKDAYKALREKERAKIIAYLNEQKDDEGKQLFTNASLTNVEKITLKGGMGRSDYGKGKFNVLYNLTNWKYVEAIYKGIKFHISLQCFDYDTGTNNMIVLYDKIGIYLYDNENPTKLNVETDDSVVEVNDYMFKMIPTNYDLPLSESALEGLKNQIINLCEEKITQAKS